MGIMMIIMSTETRRNNTRSLVARDAVEEGAACNEKGEAE